MSELKKGSCLASNPVEINRGLDAGLGSGCCTASIVQSAFGTRIPGNLANVSVNDYFRLVIWLRGLPLIRLSCGFFTFHALSPFSGSLS